MGIIEKNLEKGHERQKQALVEEASEVGLQVLQIHEIVLGAPSAKATMAASLKAITGGKLKTDHLQVFELGSGGGQRQVYVQPYAGVTVLPGEHHLFLPGSFSVPIALQDEAVFGGPAWVCPQNKDLAKKLNKEQPELKKVAKRAEFSWAIGMGKVDLEWAVQVFSVGSGSSRLVMQTGRYGGLTTYKVGFSFLESLKTQFRSVLDQKERPAQEPLFPFQFGELLPEIDVSLQSSQLSSSLTGPGVSSDESISASQSASVSLPQTPTEPVEPASQKSAGGSKKWPVIIGVVGLLVVLGVVGNLIESPDTSNDSTFTNTGKEAASKDTSTASVGPVPNDPRRLLANVPNESRNIMLLNLEHKSSIDFDLLTRQLPFPIEVKSLMQFIAKFNLVSLKTIEDVKVHGTMALVRAESKGHPTVWIDARRTGGGESLTYVPIKATKLGSIAPDKETLVLLSKHSFGRINEGWEREKTGSPEALFEPFTDVDNATVAQIRALGPFKKPARLFQTIEIEIPYNNNKGLFMSLIASAPRGKGKKLATLIHRSVKNARGPIGKALSTGKVKRKGDTVNVVFLVPPDLVEKLR